MAYTDQQKQDLFTIETLRMKFAAEATDLYGFATLWAMNELLDSWADGVRDGSVLREMFRDVDGVAANLDAIRRELDEATVYHACDNCGARHTGADLHPVRKLWERVAVGCPMPSGECAECGSLCYPQGEGESAEG